MLCHLQRGVFKVPSAKAGSLPVDFYPCPLRQSLEKFWASWTVIMKASFSMILCLVSFCVGCRFPEANMVMKSVANAEYNLKDILSTNSMVQKDLDEKAAQSLKNRDNMLRLCLRVSASHLLYRICYSNNWCKLAVINVCVIFLQLIEFDNTCTYSGEQCECGAMDNNTICMRLAGPKQMCLCLTKEDHLVGDISIERLQSIM